MAIQRVNNFSDLGINSCGAVVLRGSSQPVVSVDARSDGILPRQRVDGQLEGGKQPVANDTLMMACIN